MKDTKTPEDFGSSKPLHRTSDSTLIAALRVSAVDIQCDDGVANAAILATTTRVEFKFDERSLLRCPTCNTPL